MVSDWEPLYRKVRRGDPLSTEEVEILLRLQGEAYRGMGVRVFFEDYFRGSPGVDVDRLADLAIAYQRDPERYA